MENMGWEILHDSETKYAVFFCNVDNKTIGSAFSTGYGFSKKGYYDWFSKRGEDPRMMELNAFEKEIEILKMLGEEPEITAIIKLSNGKTRLVKTTLDSFEHKVSFPYSEDYVEDDYDYHEEAEEYINDQIKNHNFCGQWGWSGLMWCITSINTSKGRQTVDEALQFPETIPNSEELLKSCIGLSQS